MLICLKNFKYFGAVAEGVNNLTTRFEAICFYRNFENSFLKIYEFIEGAMCILPRYTAVHLSANFLSGSSTMKIEWLFSAQTFCKKA